MTRALTLPLVLLLALCWAPHALPNTEVSLQLPWDHEYRYAGYYAAEDEGYYKDYGLGVEIRSGFTHTGERLDPITEVLAGRATFGVAGIELLYHPEASQQLRILAPIFQQTATSLFSLQDTPLGKLQDLVGKRIAYLAASSELHELKSLLRQLGIDTHTMSFVASPAPLELLTQGAADVILGYSPRLQYQAQKKNLPINELSLGLFQRRHYSDILFTRADTLQRKPVKVANFIEATKQGWLLALENPTAVVNTILRKYPQTHLDQNNLAAYNTYIAKALPNFIQYPAVPIGFSDPVRWQVVVDSLLQIGALTTPLNINSMLWRPQQDGKNLYELLPFLAGICLSIGLILFFVIRGRHQPLLLALAVTVVLGTLAIERWLISQKQELLRLSLLESNMQMRAQIEGVLNNTLTGIHGMATYVSAQPDISQRDFKDFAAAMMRRDPSIRNIVLAPDLVVSYVYPMKGNEAALGLDYHKNDAQREAAFRVRDRGEMVLAGPLELVQGGQAFIARAPVFINSNGGELRFWGLVAAPIDAARLLLRTGLDPKYLLTPGKPVTATTIAIRGKDGKGTLGEVFYGDPAVFNNPEALTVPINIGSDSWMLATLPPQGTALEPQTLFATRATALLVFIIFCMLISLLRRQENRRELYEENIRQNQRLLTEIGDMAQVAGLRIVNGNTVTEISAQAFNIMQMDVRTPPFSADDLTKNLSRVAGLKLLFVMRKCQESGERQQTEIQVDHPDGKVQWIKVIFSPQGRNELIGAIQDITRQKVNENTIREQATMDRITQLPNRWFFTEQTAIELTKAKRENTKVALLFIDVDNFKSINDSLGHATGDDFLRAIAARLRACTRESDVVARLGGDEFTVLLTNIEDYKNAFKVAEQIIRSMNQAFMLLGNQIFSSVSIGISVFPEDATTTETLLSHADQAMYASKQSGKNNASFFTLAMQEHSERQHWIYNELVQAIEEDQLSVAYQPIFNLADESIADCEALARWYRPDGETISPAEFIPVAESSGLISRLDLVVLRKSLTLLTQTKNMGVSVNISPRLFHETEKGFANWRAQLLEHPQKTRVTVEITERLLVDDRLDAEALLAELQREGLDISLDDFGTGYSSLSYLSRFNVNKLKIDRSFVMAIGRSKTQETLIETILSMGEKLGIDVVAEGIETQEQLDFLRNRGCRYGQGFFLAKPMPDVQLIKLLGEKNAAPTTH
ncbi:EAL domain-containing protein [Simiduia sp. 21SJ11W-1]|uniref:EAL domain-containing protein n=1 Tax=Simiduia sp. 21SJ11W-1 TaxID=2909669 RepID=UPI0020A1C728|nr:EAL domain-containing protein [Simiduia sp. 21SJ11W-1]UTA46969.1 EAL domain-containing protein [Simiduia sp. 21SJ11W-1]